MLIKLYNFVSEKLPVLSGTFRLCRTAPACSFLIKFTWCFSHKDKTKKHSGWLFQIEQYALGIKRIITHR
jgi:hypothetical protein